MNVVAPKPGIHLLAEALAERLRQTPRTILYLSRNDLEPGRAIEERFPGARLTIWTKASFQGKTALQVIRALRREAYDLFVFHDRPLMQQRLGDLYRLVALAVRARQRFLIAAEMERGELAGAWRIEEVRPLASLPGLTGRLLLEAAGTAALLLYTPLSLGPGGRRPGAARAAPPRPTRFTPKRHYRIAYLRTDPTLDVKAGGSVSHISGVAGGMRAAGHEVFFISSEALPGMEKAGSEVHVIPPGETIRVFDEAAMVAYHHRFIRQARPLLARLKPDLLYQRHSVFSAAGARLARTFGVPLILEANHSEMHARIMWSRLHLRRLASQMELHAFRNADVIVAVSEIGRQQLARFGADPARILVNPNGVDPAIFSPDIDGSAVRRRYGFDRDEIVAGFLGTFTKWHGVLFLADMVAPLAARFPRFRMLFMGDGDLRSAVEERLDSKGVRRICAFTGLIDHARVPAHLAACDILVSPHLPFEDGTPFFGSPTKLFEYMAMAKTVVASNLGQIGEVVRHDESGLLFTPGSEGEFVEQMSRALGDDLLRRRLGQGARRRVLESYTWEQNVRRVLAFLEER